MTVNTYKLNIWSLDFNRTEALNPFYLFLTFNFFFAMAKSQMIIFYKYYQVRMMTDGAPLAPITLGLTPNWT